MYVLYAIRSTLYAIPDTNYELRTTNYQLNTSDEPQATCDEFALFCAFCANFCAFCASFASLCLIKHLFSRPKTSIISVNPVILSNFSPFLCAFCAFLRPKNPFNPRLINDLRSTKVYVRKNNLFMQNKAKFRKVKLNVNKVLTRNYDQLDTWSSGTKQSQTNPKQTQTKPIKANKMPKQTQFKPNQTQSPAGSSAACKKSISCARQLVRKSTGSSIKSLPKITENNPGVEKTSHKEENKIKTRLIQGV